MTIRLDQDHVASWQDGDYDAGRDGTMGYPHVAADVALVEEELVIVHHDEIVLMGGATCKYLRSLQFPRLRPLVTRVENACPVSDACKASVDLTANRPHGSPTTIILPD